MNNLFYVPGTVISKIVSALDAEKIVMFLGHSKEDSHLSFLKVIPYPYEMTKMQRPSSRLIHLCVTRGVCVSKTKHKTKTRPSGTLTWPQKITRQDKMLTKKSLQFYV